MHEVLKYRTSGSTLHGIFKIALNTQNHKYNLSHRQISQGLDHGSLLSSVTLFRFPSRLKCCTHLDAQVLLDRLEGRVRQLHVHIRFVLRHIIGKPETPTPEPRHVDTAVRPPPDPRLASRHADVR